MSSTNWESNMVGRKKMAIPMTRKRNGFKGRKILVVDDNAIILHVLSGILEDEDFIVTTAGSGVAALNALRQEDFDLIITDFVMPGMDGISLLKKAKAMHPGLPVILLTGSPSRARQRLTDIKVDALLEKPLYREELLHRVACCLVRHDRKVPDMRRAV